MAIGQTMSTMKYTGCSMECKGVNSIKFRKQKSRTTMKMFSLTIKMKKESKENKKSNLRKMMVKKHLINQKILSKKILKCKAQQTHFSNKLISSLKNYFALSYRQHLIQFFSSTAQQLLMQQNIFCLLKPNNRLVILKYCLQCHQISINMMIDISVEHQKSL